MAERSDACSGETLLASCTRKKRPQRKMTKGFFVPENIGMFSKSYIDRNSLIYPRLFERPARPMFIKLSYSCDDRTPAKHAASGLWEERKSLRLILEININKQAIRQYYTLIN